MPRFVLFLRASHASEGSAPPDPKMFEEMSVFNTAMVDAGVMQSGEGLVPSSRDSTRVTFHDSGAPTTQAGPFPTNELISGWWILKVKDAEEAVGWAKKVPAMVDGAIVEVRRIGEMDDFGDLMSEEVRKKEEELMKRLAGN